jgi:hypothetical protein
MTRFRVNQPVTAPNGNGTVWECTPARVKVCIKQHDWHEGGEYPAGTYPGKFDSNSPSINATYDIEQVRER